MHFDREITHEALRAYAVSDVSCLLASNAWFR